MPPTPHYRFFGTYRLLLALMVAISHLQYKIVPVYVGRHIDKLGTIGVYLFFVLSGFVISETLATFYRNRPTAFIANRMLRIFPPYFVTCILAILTAFWLRGQHLPIMGAEYDYSILLNWKTLLYNILAVFDYRIPDAHNPYYVYVGPVWSLVIEWQFYLIAGLVCFLCAWIKPQYNHTLLLMGLLLVMYGCWLTGLSPDASIFAFVQFFCIGVIIYAFCSSSGYKARLLLGVLFVVMALRTLAPLYHINMPSSVPIALGTGFVAIGLLAFLSREIPTSSRLKRIDTACGHLSYPLFLNHSVVHMMLCAYIAERGWHWLWLGIALSMLVSALAFFITELPLYRLRNRIRGNTL